MLISHPPLTLVSWIFLSCFYWSYDGCNMFDLKPPWVFLTSSTHLLCPQPVWQNAKCISTHIFSATSTHITCLMKWLSKSCHTCCHNLLGIFFSDLGVDFLGWLWLEMKKTGSRRWSDEHEREWYKYIDVCAFTNWLSSSTD